MLPFTPSHRIFPNRIIEGKTSYSETFFVPPRKLILKKLYDLVSNSFNRYINAEKRLLIAVVENLWDKYAVSSRELESRRAETLKRLDGFLEGLGYLKKEVP